MSRAAALQRTIAPPEVASDLRLHSGGQPPKSRPDPAVANGHLALVLFMGTETMLFAALTGALLVFRISSLTWPPPGQPYLPLGVTFVNSAVLFVSAWFMHTAVAAVRLGDQVGLRRGLLAALALGSAFLFIQGIEWMRLIAHGLTLSSSTYGATFYVLIGLHGLHVVGAVMWLAVVVARSIRGRYGRDHYAGVQLTAIYWYYVSALWAVLFAVVYQR